MNPLKRRSVEIAARDPRLIGDQNQCEPGVPQQSKPLDRAWRKLDSVRVPQVDFVDDDGSIPVDEGKPLRGDGFFHQCAPTLARAMVEVAPQGRSRSIKVTLPNG